MDREGTTLIWKTFFEIFRELGSNWRILLKHGSIFKDFFQTERIGAQLPPKNLVSQIGEKLCTEDEYRFF